MRSTDPDVVRARLLATLDINLVSFPDGPARLAAHINHLQLTGMGLSYFEYGSAVVLETSGTSVVRQVFSLDGEAIVTAHGQPQKILANSWSPVIPANVSLLVDFAPNHHQLALQIERTALLRTLASILGEEKAAHWSFLRTLTLDQMQ